MTDSGAKRHLLVLGIRGLPAAHGGFETFAERLALWLRDRGWRITVYCQGSASGRREEDDWQGIRRVHLPVHGDGAWSTIEFDIAATREALRTPGVMLTLGYNTGFLSSWVRLRGRANAINMDGLEWKRQKYSLPQRAYLWLNERLAAWAGNRLIADHPAIAARLATIVPSRKIVMIPYGGDELVRAQPEMLDPLGLTGGDFATLIARPVPENSILEIVRAFSRRPRGMKLAVLGTYAADNAYHQTVRAAASDEVVFTGAIYDPAVLAALRLGSRFYAHGHQVGGTNPSLVEALAAGNPVIAHDNVFNRWVAGDAGRYFADEAGCAALLDQLTGDEAALTAMAAAARTRWHEAFTWAGVLGQYERLLAELADSLG